MRANREWQIQDGGHRTKSINTLACRRDYQRNFDGYAYVLMVLQFIDAKKITIPTNRKWKIMQDGGRHNYMLSRLQAGT